MFLSNKLSLPAAPLAAKSLLCLSLYTSNSYV